MLLDMWVKIRISVLCFWILRGRAALMTLEDSPLPLDFEAEILEHDCWPSHTQNLLKLFGREKQSHDFLHAG